MTSKNIHSHNQLVDSLDNFRSLVGITDIFSNCILTNLYRVSPLISLKRLKCIHQCHVCILQRLKCKNINKGRRLGKEELLKVIRLVYGNPETSECPEHQKTKI